MQHSARQDLTGKRIVLMGLGLHGGGLATTKWLLRHGATVLVTDLRTRAQLVPTLRKISPSSRLSFVLGKHRLKDFQHADLIVQNPGVPHDSPYLREAKRNGIAVANEATLFFRYCPATIIAVTGSKGKSTTSALIAHMLKTKYGSRVVLAGNIRTTPMLSVLDRLTARDLAVVELSSWHLELFSRERCRPHIAVVTNLLDDHLNRYASRRAYFNAKALIWQWQREHDVLLLNADNAPSRTWNGRPRSKILWFSKKPLRQDGAYLRNGTFVIRKNGKERLVATINDLRLPGEHNQMNVLAAMLAVAQAGVSAPAMRKALRAFRGIPNRLEKVRTVNGIAFYNDTSATTPDAAIAALHSFPGKPIFITGGTDKGLAYREFAKELRRSAKAIILLPGSATEKLKKPLGSFPYREAPTMQTAVNLAKRIAERGDTVVLSPAAASFEHYQHEFDRGEQFVAAVNKLHEPSPKDPL